MTLQIPVQFMNKSCQTRTWRLKKIFTKSKTLLPTKSMLHNNMVYLSLVLGFRLVGLLFTFDCRVSFGFPFSPDRLTQDEMWVRVTWQRHKVIDFVTWREAFYGTWPTLILTHVVSNMFRWHFSGKHNINPLADLPTVFAKVAEVMTFISMSE